MVDILIVFKRTIMSDQRTWWHKGQWRNFYKAVCQRFWNGAHWFLPLVFLCRLSIAEKDRGTYLHNRINLVISTVVHVVGEHLANFLEFEFSCAAESDQELICHPWILRCVFVIDGEPILERPKHHYLVVVQLANVPVVQTCQLIKRRGHLTYPGRSLSFTFFPLFFDSILKRKMNNWLYFITVKCRVPGTWT